MDDRRDNKETNSLRMSRKLWIEGLMEHVF